MIWGLVGKGSIPHVATEARRILHVLESKEQEVLVHHDLAEFIARPGSDMPHLDGTVDLFITVGGDGTILYAQQSTDKPVFGVNAGAIGFLAEVEPKEAGAGIDAILRGDYEVEERQKLAASIDGEDIQHAVNEVTLQTRRIAKLIRFRVSVDGHELDTYRGDGIIVSTPTGSTGYSMSVGGPLVHPRVNGIILAPIAPFKLAARPWVVPGNAVIELTLLERDSAQGVQQARVVVDGQHGYDLATGATVTIRTGAKKARFIRLGEGFYDRVRHKLTR